MDNANHLNYIFEVPITFFCPFDLEEEPISIFENSCPCGTQKDLITLKQEPSLRATFLLLFNIEQ